MMHNLRVRLGFLSRENFLNGLTWGPTGLSVSTSVSLLLSKGFHSEWAKNSLGAVGMATFLACFGLGIVLKITDKNSVQRSKEEYLDQLRLFASLNKTLYLMLIEKNEYVFHKSMTLLQKSEHNTVISELIFTLQEHKAEARVSDFDDNDSEKDPHAYQLLPAHNLTPRETCYDQWVHYPGFSKTAIGLAAIYDLSIIMVPYAVTLLSTTTEPTNSTLLTILGATFFILAYPFYKLGYRQKAMWQQLETVKTDFMQLIVADIRRINLLHTLSKDITSSSDMTSSVMASSQISNQNAVSADYFSRHAISYGINCAPSGFTVLNFIISEGSASLEPQSIISILFGILGLCIFFAMGCAIRAKEDDLRRHRSDDLKNHLSHLESIDKFFVWLNTEFLLNNKLRDQLKEKPFPAFEYEQTLSYEQLRDKIQNPDLSFYQKYIAYPGFRWSSVGLAVFYVMSLLSTPYMIFSLFTNYQILDFVPIVTLGMCSLLSFWPLYVVSYHQQELQRNFAEVKSHCAAKIKYDISRFEELQLRIDELFGTDQEQKNRDLAKYENKMEEKIDVMIASQTIFSAAKETPEKIIAETTTSRIHRSHRPF